MKKFGPRSQGPRKGKAAEHPRQGTAPDEPLRRLVTLLAEIDVANYLHEQEQEEERHT